MHALARLLSAAMTRRGLNGNQVAGRMGRPTYRTRVYWLTSTNREPLREALDRDVIRDLAGALTIPEAAIWHAIGEELGLKVAHGESDLARRLPADTDHLTDAQVTLVLDLVEALVERSTPAAEPLFQLPVQRAG